LSKRFTLPPMRTLDQKRDLMELENKIKAWAKGITNLVVVLTLAVLVVSCKKDAAVEAITTDANGYLCLKCGAKYYTSRAVFMESKCPKCQEYGIEDVVGYLCKKDNHLTIRPRLGGPEGKSTCEKCGAYLESAMVMPRETNLLVWGAIKTKTAP
jgi:hypothetical protein